MTALSLFLSLQRYFDEDCRDIPDISAIHDHQIIPAPPVDRKRVSCKKSRKFASSILKQHTNQKAIH